MLTDPPLCVCQPALRDLLASQGLSLVRDITGIPLNDSVDATCAKYDYTGPSHASPTSSAHQPLHHPRHISSQHTNTSTLLTCTPATVHPKLCHTFPPPSHPRTHTTQPSNGVLVLVQTRSCATMTSWRGGALLSFTTWSRPLGQRRMGELWISTALMVAACATALPPVAPPTPSPSFACSKSAARQGGPVTPPKVEHFCLL